MLDKRIFTYVCDKYAVDALESAKMISEYRSMSKPQLHPLDARGNRDQRSVSITHAAVPIFRR